jgi:hypothetical protein
MPENLDEPAIARSGVLGDDDTITGALFGTGAAKSHLEHNILLKRNNRVESNSVLSHPGVKPGQPAAYHLNASAISNSDDMWRGAVSY